MIEAALLIFATSTLGFIISLALFCALVQFVVEHPLDAGIIACSLTLLWRMAP